MYKVGIVLPALNGGDMAIAVVTSILSQVVNFDYQLLIIDSGSTDGSLEYFERISKVDGRLRIIRIPKSEFGHGKTRNLGARSIDAEYVAFVTQDALPANGNWLSALVEPLDRDASVAGVFGKHVAYPSAGALLINDINQHMAGFENGPDVVFMDDPIRYRNDIAYKQFLHFYSDNSSCLRKSIWEKIPYPEIEYGEDQAWAKKIIEAGYKKAFARHSVVYHSHNYTSREIYDKSYVDRKFWLEQFGYTSVCRFKDVLRETFLLTRSQALWLSNFRKSHPSMAEVLGILLKNFCRFWGEYRAYLNWRS